MDPCCFLPSQMVIRPLPQFLTTNLSSPLYFKGSRLCTSRFNKFF